MPRRYTILFLLMVAVPLALLAWLGSIMVRQDEERTRAAWMNVLNQQLTGAKVLVTQEMVRLGGELDALLQNVPLQEEALRGLPREQPLVRHAFLLDDQSRLVLPSLRTASGEGEAAAFLRRTQPVWESGVRFGKVAKPVVLEAANTSPSSSGGTWSLLREGRLEVYGSGKGKSASAAASLESGWHVWFYGNGPQILFWQERADRRVVGVEVEMAALLSQLINRLNGQPAAEDGGLWRLREVQGGRVLNEWGGPSSAGERTPAAVQACADPLSMWQLEIYPPPGAEPRGNTLPVLLGAGGAGLGLLGLAWLLHREGTRETREARRRVSFVNQVSHELKTPLTNIRLYAEMAQQRAASVGDPTMVRHLGVVEAETSRLSRLIHNVLTFARQQRDQLTVRLQPGSLDEVVERVTDLWRPGLEAKGFSVEVKLEASRPLIFDPDAVEQILGNLLSNAEKYAAAGRWVGIATQASGTEARLVVEDAGPGVPAGMREAVFAPFVRLRHDLAEGASGTGIGLAISRQLAQLQGGALVLEESAKGGARFILIFPNHHDDHPDR